MSCNLNAQFTHQRYGHVFHLCIIQMSKLGIYSGQLKSIPNLSHPSCACITSEGPLFTHNLNVSTYNLDPGNNFHPYFIFFNKVSCQKIISALTIVAATTIHLFGYPTRSKHPPLQLIKKFIHFFCNHRYESSIFQVDEGG